MRDRKSRLLGWALAASALMGAGQAQASLTLFKSYVGNYGLSTDGGGNNDGDSYTISAFVPLGATVTAAYLYQATWSSTGTPESILLDGNALTFDPQVPNATACCSLASARADVTSLIAAAVDGGPGGQYDFNITEGNTGTTDGTALAVVYSLPSLATNTVALLDGFASVTGDSTTLNFADPLDPTAPGFQAEMRLGIGFSCCGQQSNVNVNGTTITTAAGNNDDGIGGLSNGQLITMGGNDDPFSPALPGYDVDHERYDLTPYINPGDTSINVLTSNASQDDNIFLAAFLVSGTAGINEPPPGVPEPSTWAMLIAGFGMTGGAMRLRRQRVKTVIA